jgi:hypothetical protein
MQMQMDPVRGIPTGIKLLSSTEKQFLPLPVPHLMAQPAPVQANDASKLAKLREAIQQAAKNQVSQ